MRPDLDCDIAVADQVEVRVMVLGLGNLTDALEEIKGRDEVLDAPLAAEPFAVVAKPPRGHRRQQLAYSLRRERRDIALARGTVLLHQVAGWRGCHGVSSSVSFQW